MSESDFNPTGPLSLEAFKQFLKTDYSYENLMKLAKFGIPVEQMDLVISAGLFDEIEDVQDPENSTFDPSDYYKTSIKNWIYSGLYNPVQTKKLMIDILEPGDSINDYKIYIKETFESYKKNMLTWSAITDCDRLSNAFNKLHQHKILGIHNAGFTNSDGHQTAYSNFKRRSKNTVHGYCFYHWQDIERALHGDGLYVTFSDIDQREDIQKIGQTIFDTLVNYGLNCKWDGTAEQKIGVTPFNWQWRRVPGS